MPQSTHNKNSQGDAKKRLACITMSISEVKAIELAIEFIKKSRRENEIPIAYESGHAILNCKKRNMPWVSVAVEGEEYWIVYFDLEVNDPLVATMDPSEVAVMVSANSKMVEWLPLL